MLFHCVEQYQTQINIINITSICQITLSKCNLEIKFIKSTMVEQAKEKLRFQNKIHFQTEKFILSFFNLNYINYITLWL